MALHSLLRRIVNSAVVARGAIRTYKVAHAQIKDRKRSQHAKHVVGGVQLKVNRAVGLNIHERANLNKNKYQQGKTVGPKKDRRYVPGVADKRKEIADQLRVSRRVRGGKGATRKWVRP